MAEDHSSLSYVLQFKVVSYFFPKVILNSGYKILESLQLLKLVETARKE